MSLQWLHDLLASRPHPLTSAIVTIPSAAELKFDAARRKSEQAIAEAKATTRETARELNWETLFPREDSDE